MKKIFLTVIALLVISMSSVNAQAVWGLRVGLSTPQFTSRDGTSRISNFGWEVGLVLYYSLKNDFYINSGLMYSMKSLKISMSTETMSYEASYIEIPLYIGHSIPLGRVSSYAQLGPYIGFKLSEKESSMLYSEDMDFINSYNAGLGIMYGINIKRFKIEVGYQYGFINFFNDKIENDVKLNTLFLGISYVF